jgi:hypothetical protein
MTLPNLLAGGYLFVLFFLAFVALTPFFIWLQLRQVIKLLKAIRDSNEQIAENTTPAGSRPRSESSGKYVMPE